MTDVFSRAETFLPGSLKPRAGCGFRALLGPSTAKNMPCSPTTSHPGWTIPIPIPAKSTNIKRYFPRLSGPPGARLRAVRTITEYAERLRGKPTD